MIEIVSRRYAFFFALMQYLLYYMFVDITFKLVTRLVINEINVLNTKKMLLMIEGF